MENKIRVKFILSFEEYTPCSITFLGDIIDSCLRSHDYEEEVEVFAHVFDTCKTNCRFCSHNKLSCSTCYYKMKHESRLFEEVKTSFEYFHDKIEASSEPSASIAKKQGAGSSKSDSKSKPSKSKERLARKAHKRAMTLRRSRALDAKRVPKDEPWDGYCLNSWWNLKFCPTPELALDFYESVVAPDEVKFRREPLVE